ncbi:hypothetical protein [Agromyces sp. M3QZ16-3]|uniref:hypothetical protein n=1 Tax=Agromyces sp. M3QZ16-3 TaxID=3447585 RepID=UPI003F693254
MTLRTTSALAVPAIAMLLLAGCTGAPGGGTRTGSDGASAGSDQTVDEACTELRTGLDELSSVDGAALQSDLVDDPDAAIATMDEVESAIVAATDAVTNAELRPAAEDAADAATSFFDQARAAAQDPATADPATLQAGLSALASAVGELQAACEG